MDIHSFLEDKLTWSSLITVHCSRFTVRGTSHGLPAGRQVDGVLHLLWNNLEPWPLLPLALCLWPLAGAPTGTRNQGTMELILSPRWSRKTSHAVPSTGLRASSPPCGRMSSGRSPQSPRRLSACRSLPTIPARSVPGSYS